MPSPEEVYIDFTSKVSFLEFIQDEFKYAKVPVEELRQKISLLKSKSQWNINDLSEYVKNYPRSFIIFQNIFQLLRFTNAQIIHFVFDIVKLNSLNIDAIYEYMILNLKHDINFRKIYFKTINHNSTLNDFIAQINQSNKKSLIAKFKTTISIYTERIIKNFSILESRVAKSEFEDFSIRFSNYLLNNLKLNETLNTINIEKYLKNKRIPLDTKSLHGNYLKIKIIKALENNGYKNIDFILNNEGIKTLKHDLTQQGIATITNNNKIFCTERFVEQIVKTNNNKPKKFDLIIFNGGRPKYLFEMNFYSTEGTKIGINNDEYVALNKYIKENFKDYKFYWITDGNYWLTTQGKVRFINLLNHFDKIFNINIFSENVNNF